MIDLSLYRRLAADGNKDAQIIVDAAEAEPEGDPAASEPQEQDAEEPDAEDLAEFAQKVGALKAQADILSAAGDHRGAADVHMHRAREFDWRDQPAEAMRAYRDAATSYSKHADEACAQLTPEQVQAWHAKKSSGG